MRKQKKSVYVNKELKTMLVLSGYTVEQVGDSFQCTVRRYWFRDEAWIEGKPFRYGLHVRTTNAAWASVYRHWVWNQNRLGLSEEGVNSE